MADRPLKKTNLKKINQQKTRPPVHPSVVDACARESGTADTDGGTAGSGSSIDDQNQTPAPPGGRRNEPPAQERPVAPTPGVELLLAIGAQQPEFLLSGRTLADQGLAVTGMLAEGWLPDHLRQIIAGRPLPVPVRTTVGAVVASRLRAAMAGPAPSRAPRLPQQRAADWGYAPGPAATPSPPSWTEQHDALEAAAAGRGPLRDCDGDGGLCQRLAIRGEAMCGEHLGWELCPQCAARRVEPGVTVCDYCKDTPDTETALGEGRAGAAEAHVS
ncbi:hypothetical protein AB0H73_14860 [Streptomyces olivoreticuli]